MTIAGCIVVAKQEAATILMKKHLLMNFVVFIIVLSGFRKRVCGRRDAEYTF